MNKLSTFSEYNWRMQKKMLFFFLFNYAAACHAGFGTLDRNELWPQGIIPYYIEPGDPNATVIRQAVKHWESYTPLKFIELSKTGKDGVFDYLAFKVADIKGGHAGPYPGRHWKANSINLQSGASFRTTVHEIGHKVGLAHEHQRPDSSKYITFYPANMTPQARIEYAKIESETLKPIGAYDYSSIMHYGSAQGSANRKAVFTKINGQILDSSQFLSAGDIATIKEMYKDVIGAENTFHKICGKIKKTKSPYSSNEDVYIEVKASPHFISSKPGDWTYEILHQSHQSINWFNTLKAGEDICIWSTKYFCQDKICNSIRAEFAEKQATKEKVSFAHHPFKEPFDDPGIKRFSNSSRH